MRKYNLSPLEETVFPLLRKLVRQMLKRNTVEIWLYEDAIEFSGFSQLLITQTDPCLIHVFKQYGDTWKTRKAFKVSISVCLNRFVITNYIRYISPEIMDYPNSISTHDFKFLTEPYEWSSDTVVREQNTTNRKWTGRNCNLIMTSAHDNIVGHASYYQNGIDYLLFGEWFFPPKYIFLDSWPFKKASIRPRR